MELDTIHLLYGYDDWVNQRLLADAERLPADQTRQFFGASFDSIHGTLAHILGAQINWLSRWKGTSPTRSITGDDFESIAAIRVRWDRHRRELADFLADLTTDRLNAPLAYRSTDGEAHELPLGHLMIHVVNHGTHHRSELADMLTRLGHAPRPTDFTRYLFARAGQE